MTTNPRSPQKPTGLTRCHGVPVTLRCCVNSYSWSSPWIPSASIFPQELLGHFVIMRTNGKKKKKKSKIIIITIIMWSEAYKLSVPLATTCCAANPVFCCWVHVFEHLLQCHCLSVCPHAATRRFLCECTFKWIIYGDVFSWIICSSDVFSAERHNMLSLCKRQCETLCLTSLSIISSEITALVIQGWISAWVVDCDSVASGI